MYPITTQNPHINMTHHKIFILFFYLFLASKQSHGKIANIKQLTKAIKKNNAIITV